VIEYLLIGKIDSVTGNDGFVKITSYSDFPKRFHALSEVYLDFWGDKKKFIIEKTGYHKQSLLIKFKNFNCKRDTQLLEGKEIFITSDDVIKLPENNFFIHDLIGSKVLINDAIIGVITDVLKTPANDVIVLKGDNDKEILLPFVPDFIERFDPERKIMILKQDIDLSDDED